jgi:hypothetical protein
VAIFNVPCPSCGGTRAFAALSELRFLDALQFNPLLVAAIPLGLIGSLFRGFLKRYERFGWSLLAAAVAANWVLSLFVVAPARSLTGGKTGGLVTRVMETEEVNSFFQSTFGKPPVHVVRAPGRLELLGNHTDYNGGLVMSLAVDKYVYIAASPRNDAQVELASSSFPQARSFTSIALEKKSGARRGPITSRRPAEIARTRA